MEKCYFENGRNCRCLVVKNCTGCAFRKTKEQIIEGRNKAAKRLMTLDNGAYFFEKYYPPRH